ncbi:sensor histidine kinase [Flavilitoribacter nigricans]|nr:ATP-binding protein [Flavilitoribacter nigricans]
MDCFHLSRFALLLLLIRPALQLPGQAIDTLDLGVAENYSLAEVQAYYEKSRLERDTFSMAQSEQWFYWFHTYQEEGTGPGVAYEHLRNAHDLYAAIGNKVNLRYILVILADFQLKRGFHHEAMQLFHRAIDLNRELGDMRSLSHCYSELSRTYLLMVDTANYLFYLDLATDLALTEKDSFLLGILYTERGTFDMDEGDFGSAIDYSRKAVAIGKDVFIPCIGWSIALEGVARQYRGEYAAAIPILKSAIPYHRKLREMEAVQKYYGNISECFRNLHQMDSAYHYLMESKLLGDSLALANVESRMNELLVEYNTREKEAEISRQQAELDAREARARQQKQAITVLIGGIIIAIFVLLGVYKYFIERVRAQKQLAAQERLINQQEKTRLAQENELETVKSLVEGQEIERQRFARELHDGLGGMLSALRLQLDQLNPYLPPNQEQLNQKALHILKHSVEEVRAISRNSLPKALERSGLITALQDYSSSLTAERGPLIDVQQYGRIALSADEELSVYRIIQELINNAVKHAACREIMVLIVQAGQDVSISVEDDGRGFDHLSAKTGSGLYLLRQRVNVLKGELIIDSSPLAGSSFMVNFRCK